jgi:2-polyprenyl-3-methyl-5-hydroxy-6-metoxy-1,4-benzoquinol methylase
MDYRETLYRNYSDSLGRVSIDSVHHAVFSESYPELPAKKSSLIGDLGCGQGIWLRWLAGLGYNNLVGIDVSLAELKLADKTGDSMDSRPSDRGVTENGRPVRSTALQGFT